MYQVLPPDLTEKEFSNAIREFSRILGTRWVFTESSILSTYKDPYSPFSGKQKELLASAAICPANIEDIRNILIVANHHKIPLWIISGGRNFGYGGPAPRLSGSVVLDLKRLNRILEVNKEHAYALVEPGVSSIDLYRYIKKNRLGLWMDGPSPAWASVMGSSLEHGIGHGLLSDRWECECGMEVVLANGEVIRTAMGGMENAATWMNYKWGFGPHIDGLFSQSNFGIVTKMGTRLHPEPASFLSCRVIVKNYEDVIPLIDLLRPLRQSGVIKNGINIRPFRNPEGADSENRGWRALIGLYDLAKVNEIHWELIKTTFSAIPDVEFQVKKFSAPYNPQEMDWTDKWLAGIPSMSELNRWSHDFIGVSQVMPFDGRDVWHRIKVIDDLFREYGLRYYGSSVNAHHHRSLIGLSGIRLNTNRLSNIKAMELATRILEDVSHYGWGSYREATLLMDNAMHVYDYNNHSLLRFHETIKDALDPAGILAAGKSGIWPAYLRK